jgi:HK97 family phage portal protein
MGLLTNLADFVWPVSVKSEPAPEQKSAYGPESILRDILGAGNSKSGQPVTLRTALEVTTVYACARVIAEGLAQVPFKIYQRGADGRRREARDHPLWEKFHYRPNDWQTPFEFREQIGLHLALCGNAYVFVSRSTSGGILELMAFEPGSVTVTRNPDWSITYRVTTPDGTRVDLSAGDIWHIRGPSLNGYVGLDTLNLARNAIGLSLAAEEFASALFANGARPGGILSTDQALTPEAQEQIRAAWAASQSGSGNALKTALLAGGLKFQMLSQTADEAQMIETRNFVIPEICRAFRVNPIMVMHNENQAGYASVEQRFIAHKNDTLGPWYKRVEDSMNANLLSLSEHRDGYYVGHQTSGLMRGTAKERAEYYAIMKQHGVLTSNEWRDAEDMDRLDDPAADRALPAANLYGPEQTPDPTE